MKLIQVMETVLTFRDRVEQEVFKDWQQDGMFPIEAASIHDMDEEDYDMFCAIVDDIVDYANGWYDEPLTPRQAVDLYDQEQHETMKKEIDQKHPGITRGH